MEMDEIKNIAWLNMVKPTLSKHTQFEEEHTAKQGKTSSLNRANKKHVSFITDGVVNLER